MSNNLVCVNSNYFVIFVTISIAIIAWALYQVNQQAQHIRLLTRNNDTNILEQNLDEIIDQKLKDQHIKSQQVSNKNNVIEMLIAANTIQKQQDLQRLENPFVPPIQRGTFSPQLAEVTVPINTPTRGEYGNFQLVGYAYKPNQLDQMFQIFGRRIYSNKYEYYVIHPITQIKIPVKSKNDWEFSSGDKVKIIGFSGQFLVEIYGNDFARYVPY